MKGTYADEVEAALAPFGYAMALKESYMARPRKERPTVWTWMQKPRNAWAHYILAIHKGKEGHWILIKGVKMCDTYTEGRWTVRVRRPASRRAHHGSLRGAQVARLRPRCRLNRIYRAPGRAGPCAPT